MGNPALLIALLDSSTIFKPKFGSLQPSASNTGLQCYVQNDPAIDEEFDEDFEELNVHEVLEAIDSERPQWAPASTDSDENEQVTLKVTAVSGADGGDSNDEKVPIWNKAPGPDATNNTPDAPSDTLAGAPLAPPPSPPPPIFNLSQNSSELRA
ncbi:hypothetical protein H0H93_004601, partial [Arthromyces matolae]